MSDTRRPEGSEPVPPDAQIDQEKWPIGFMTILLLVVLYLGWRLVQAVAWVFDKI